MRRSGRHLHSLTPRHHVNDKPKKPPFIITVSRQLGSGGRRIADVLGKELKCPVHDKDILDTMANKSMFSYQRAVFEAHDEKIKGVIDDMLSCLVGQADTHIYLHLLPIALHSLANESCIILGRAAHLFVPQSFKIRVEASLETRIANLIRFENLTREKAKREIVRSDKERSRFRQQVIRTHFIRNPKIVTLPFDLTISTDNLSIPEAAALVLAAFRLKFAQRNSH